MTLVLVSGCATLGMGFSLSSSSSSSLRPILLLQDSFNLHFPPRLHLHRTRSSTSYLASFARTQHLRISTSDEQTTHDTDREILQSQTRDIIFLAVPYISQELDATMSFTRASDVLEGEAPGRTPPLIESLTEEQRRVLANAKVGDLLLVQTFPKPAEDQDEADSAAPDPSSWNDWERGEENTGSGNGTGTSEGGVENDDGAGGGEQGAVVEGEEEGGVEAEAEREAEVGAEGEAEVGAEGGADVEEASGESEATREDGAQGKPRQRRLRSDYG